MEPPCATRHWLRSFNSDQNQREHENEDVQFFYFRRAKSVGFCEGKPICLVLGDNVLR